MNENECYFEVSIGDQYSDVPKDLLKKAFHSLNERMSGCEIE